MLTSCKTSPQERPESNLIVVDPVPWLEYYSPDNPELKKIIIRDIVMYTYIQMLLIDLRSTGYTDDVIDVEIENCEEAINWLSK